MKTKKLTTGIKFSFLILILLLTTASVAQGTPWYQAAGTAVGTTANTVSVAWPAHEVGDVALLFVETQGNQSATADAGFVEVAGSPQTTGTEVRLTVFWARATSTSMAAPTVSVGASNHIYAQILTYRGVITYGDPWDVTGGGVKDAQTGSVTVTGVTTTVADTLIVQAVARDNDSAAAAFTDPGLLGGWTNANLTNITERSDAGTTAGNGGGFGVIDGGMAAAGATGNTTANVTSSRNAFLTIALKPNIMSNIYAINNSLSPNGAIMSINPANSVATIVYSGAPFPLATRAAGMAQCPDGMIYFINQTGQLYSFNPNTPAVAPVAVGAASGLDMIRMSCHPTTGVLYAMQSPVTNIYIVDKATGALTTIPMTSPPVTPPGAGSGDIGFDKEGTLYFVGEVTPGNAATERLWLINLATNNFENVGAVTGLPNVANGIAFDNSGNLLLSLSTQTRLYTVSADGGAATPVGVAGAMPAAVYDLSSVNAGISITKTSSSALLRPGDSITYTVVITAGAVVSNAVFQDPAVPYINATGVVCAAAGGATCPAPAQVTVANMQGAGITIPSMPIGGSVTFTITAIVTGNPTGALTNTANVTLGGQTASPGDTDYIKKMKTTRWREVFQ